MANSTAGGTWNSRICERLDELGVTKSMFAHSLGMSRSRLSNYLHGSREPAFDDFKLMLTALGVSADWILFGGSRPAEASMSLAMQIESLPPLLASTPTHISE
jgi:transcriptional regulator with XRE-family HTH domain